MPACFNSLRIKNLALVEDLEWEIAPGFTAITGETGAGKSIIIGALQLLLGERTDKSLIRTGAESMHGGSGFSRATSRETECASRRSGSGAVRWRSDCETQSFRYRRKPSIHQRLAHYARRPQKSW